MSKIIQSITKRSGKLEIVNAACFVVAIIFSILTNAKGAAWLLAVIGLSDAARFILCGIWYHTPYHADVIGWHCPQKDKVYTVGTKIKVGLYLLMLLAGILKIYTVEYPAWYGVIAISLFEVIRTSACVLYKQRPNWLEDNEGKLGQRTYSMIACVVAITINIHLIATNWLGNAGLIVAGFSAVACLVVMDFINPHIHEHFTRFYGWLEAFTQKFFFLGQVIAIIIAFAKTDLKLNNYSVATIIAIAAIISSIRDITMVIWHFIGRWSVNYITERNHIINLIRRVVICGWFVACLVALIENSMTFASFAALAIVGIAVLSIICLISDESDIEYSSHDCYFFEGPY